MDIEEFARRLRSHSTWSQGAWSNLSEDRKQQWRDFARNIAPEIQALHSEIQVPADEKNIALTILPGPN